MNVSYNNLFLIKMLYLIKRATPCLSQTLRYFMTKESKKKANSQIQWGDQSYCQCIGLVIAVSGSGF